MTTTQLAALGPRIREARGSLSQTALATLVGRTQAQISDYETGRVVPQLETLLAIARVCGVSLDWLVSLE